MTKAIEQQPYAINPYNNSFLLQYFDVLKREYQYIDIIRTGVDDRLGINKVIRSKNLYVNHQFTKNYINAAQEEPDKENLLNFYDVIKQYKRLVILGDPGIGKTTMVSRITTIFTDLSSNFPEAYNFPIPFPITLREFNFNKAQNFNDFLKKQYFKSDKLKECKPDMELIETVLNAGQAFIIFDGIDEISNSKQREHLAEMILELFEQYPNNKVWFTSRILGFDLNCFFFQETKGKEMETFKESLKRESIKEYWDSTIHKADLFLSKVEVKKLNIQQLYLAPFTDAQISQFARFWAVQYHPQQSDQSKYARGFVTALEKHIKIKALGRIPFLLTMMSLYFRINRRFPDGRVQLYKQIAKVYLDEMRTRNLPQFVSEFTLNEQMVGLSAIAYEMQKLRTDFDEQANIIIKREQAAQFFKEGLTAFGLCANKENVDAYIKTYFDGLNKRSEILIPKSETQYAFIHLSYQEYFAAEYWYRRYQKIKSTSFKDGHKSEKQTLFDEISKAAKHYSYAETIELFFECFKSDESSYIPEEINYVFNEIFKKYYDLNINITESAINMVFTGTSSPSQKLLFAIVSNEFIKESISSKTKSLVKVLDIKGFNQINSQILVGFKNLEALSLDDDNFHNLEQLKVFKELIKLDFSSTSVNDIIPLKDLLNLQELHFSNTKVSDLSPLQDLQQLNYLSFYQTQVSDLSPLQDLQQLKYLFFSQTQVSDLSPLQDLKQLTQLHFSNTKVSDLSSLQDLKQLIELSFYQTQISDISPLQDLQHLTLLSFSQTQVSDLSPLQDLRQLTRLSFSQTQVGDLSPLQDLQQLTELSFSQTQVSDLSPLQDLQQLTHLYFAETQVSDLSPLQDLRQLTRLSFSQTQVSDLSPLQDLPNLIYITCNRAIDVSTLRHMKNLTIRQE